MKSTLIALSLAGSLALFAGCGGEEKEASGGSVTTPKVDANTLARAKGKSVFKKTCVACHGDDGRGIEGQGKDWTKSEFITNSTDDELVAFLKVGRSVDDPANTTGVPMPKKGGNPSLTNEDLQNVVIFMRSLQE